MKSYNLLFIKRNTFKLNYSKNYRIKFITELNRKYIHVEILLFLCPKISIWKGLL